MQGGSASPFAQAPPILQHWLVPQDSGRRFFVGTLIALLLHTGLIAFFHWFTPPQEISSLEHYLAKKAPVTVTFAPKPPQGQSARETETPKNVAVLTQKEKRTQQTILQPDAPERGTKSKVIPRAAPSASKHQTLTPSTPVNPFLPPSNGDYIASLREEGAQSGQITADGGDLPIENETPAPTVGPTPKPRYEVKDLGVYQFSQAFRERFTAFWNMKERWAPPQSSLQPGDVIYYKVYLNGDGSLDRFENLTAQNGSGKNYSDVDAIFRDVIGQVLPMPIPSRLKTTTGDRRVVVTQVIAIQVVGRNLPIQFSF